MQKVNGEMASKRTEELLQWDRKHIVHSKYGMGEAITA